MKWIILFLVTSYVPGRAAAIAPSVSAGPVTRNHRTGSLSLSFSDSSAPLPAPRTKKDFLDQYGTDDTARALIRFYFYKSKGARRLIWLPYTFPVPFLLIAAIGSGDESGRSYLLLSTSEIFLSIAVAVLGVAVGLSIGNLFRFLFFRKHLLHALHKYKITGFVPKGISHSRLFRVSLRTDPDNKPEPEPVP